METKESTACFCGARADVCIHTLSLASKYMFAESAQTRADLAPSVSCSPGQMLTLFSFCSLGKGVTRTKRRKAWRVARTASGAAEPSQLNRYAAAVLPSLPLRHTTVSPGCDAGAHTEVCLMCSVDECGSHSLDIN